MPLLLHWGLDKLTDKLQTTFLSAFSWKEKNVFMKNFAGVSIDKKSASVELTHWGRVMHICVSKLNIIGSDNGLSPSRRQAIIWTNAGILLIGPLGTNLSEILIAIYTFSLKKMHLKMSSGKWWPSCLGPNELMARHQTGDMPLPEPRQAEFTNMCHHSTIWV